MKIFLLAFFALSFIQLANSQTWINEETDLYPISVNIQQDKNAQGQITGYTTSTYALGRKKNSDNSSFIARSYHDYDLTDFPDNTQIDEVKVFYSTGSTGYSFKLTKVSSISTTDLGANWSAIGNGTEMDKGISYNTGEQSFISTKIKSEMQNLLTGNKIILGALCENETANNSYSTLLTHLHVKYRRPADSYPYQALNYYKNHTGNGQIGVGLGVPPTSYPSPHPFSAIENQNINLLAYDNQDIDSKQYLYNDIEAPSNISQWDQDLFGNYTFLGHPQTITVVAKSTNAGATFRAWLKQNCKVLPNYKTEFDGNIPGPIKWIVEANVDQISAPGNGYKPGNITYNYIGWEDDFSVPNPRTVNPYDDETYTALYKYPHHSNTTAAYQNPGQRRFIRSYSGQLHMVYESMNKVWYERSTNNGQTWQIMNGGKPIYNGVATHPSIDFYPGTNDIIIVYNKDESAIAAQYYENGVFKCESIVSNSGWVTDNSKPVIAWTYTRLMVAWNEFGGYILYRLGQKVSTPQHAFSWYFDARIISDPGESDKNNPSIGTSKQQALGFWLAWDRNQTAIQFVNLDLIDNDENIQQLPIYTYGQAGFSKNEQPSISVMPNNDYRISWFGSNGGAMQVVTYWNYQFYIFGTNVSSHSMSVTDDGKAIIAYGDLDGTRNKFRQVWYWGSEKNLGTTGKQTHLSNGTSLNNMYAMSFQNATLPYSFSMSASLGSLQKVTEIPIACGRKGIVVGDSAEFYFTLGDVTLNGNTIDFIPAGINPDFGKLDTLN